MASVPHAVHAAFKVRDHLSGGPPGQESKSERFAFSAKAMSSTGKICISKTYLACAK